MRVHRLVHPRSYGFAPAAALLLLLAALAPTPAAAISAGTDVFVTMPDYSYQDFTPTPLPAGFFGPGSLPFSGIIQLNGSALGPFGNADTIVERLLPAPVPSCGDVVTVPIEMVALHLVSVQPITVNYNVGPPTQWNVEVTLSSNIMPQQTGSMTIRRTHAAGGTFSSELYVQPKFIFTNVANPLDVRTLDTGGLIPPIHFTSQGYWMDPPAAAGFDFVDILAPTPYDNDMNPGTPNKIIKQTSPDFVAGMRGVGGTCENPMTGYGKALTEEEQAWARHGALPAQAHQPQPDGVEGRACLVGGTCIVTTPSMAASLGGSYGGNNTYCQGDANDDGRDDACAAAVPGLPPWGSAALAILLLGSGVWIVSRRRALLS